MGLRNILLIINFFGLRLQRKIRSHPLTVRSISQMSGTSKDDFTKPFDAASEKTPLLNGPDLSEVKVV